MDGLKAFAAGVGNAWGWAVDLVAMGFGMPPVSGAPAGSGFITPEGLQADRFNLAPKSPQVLPFDADLGELDLMNDVGIGHQPFDD